MSETGDRVHLTWNNAGQPILGTLLVGAGCFVYLWLNCLSVVPSLLMFFGAGIAWVAFGRVYFDCNKQVIYCQYF